MNENTPYGRAVNLGPLGMRPSEMASYGPYTVFSVLYFKTTDPSASHVWLSEDTTITIGVFSGQHAVRMTSPNNGTSYTELFFEPTDALCIMLTVDPNGLGSVRKTLYVNGLYNYVDLTDYNTPYTLQLTHGDESVYLALEKYSEVKDFAWYLDRKSEIAAQTPELGSASQLIGPERVDFTVDVLVPKGASLKETEPYVSFLVSGESVGGAILLPDFENSFTTFKGTCPSGCDEVRFGVSGYSEASVVFDNIKVTQPPISWLTLPKKRREEFIQLICRIKPLKVWAALLIRWE